MLRHTHQNEERREGGVDKETGRKRNGEGDGEKRERERLEMPIPSVGMTVK